MTCDWCEKEDLVEYYDAKERKSTRWGNFCERCFQERCIGLGVGIGQKYGYNEAGKRVQLAGGTLTGKVV